MTGPQLAIVAHRGASAIAPENTLAAFTAALDLGVAVIETDIRATSDGHLVLAHDADLTRLTGQSRQIGDCTLAELRSIVIGHDARGVPQTIATPAELLALVGGRARILFDLKIEAGQLAELFRLIDTYGVTGQVIMGVRSLEGLHAIKGSHPEITTLAFGRTTSEVWGLIEAGADIVRLWSTWLDDETLAQAQRSGKPVWVMCGGPSRGDVGETTVEALIDYRRRGIETVLLNDPRLAIAANKRDLSSPTA